MTSRIETMEIEMVARREALADAVRGRMVDLGDLVAVSADPVGRLCLGDAFRTVDLGDAAVARMAHEASASGDAGLAAIAGMLSGLDEDSRRGSFALAVDGLVVASRL